MQRVAHQTFAPKGRRSVATGCAPPATKRAERNPWTHSHLNHSAPKGRRELHAANKMPRSIVKRAPRTCLRAYAHRQIAHLSTQRPSPSPLRGEKRKMDRFSTGSASRRSAAATLHPWLQPVAPLGRKLAPERRERVAGRATSGRQGKSLNCPTWLPASGTPAAVKLPASGTPADAVTDPFCAEDLPVFRPVATGSDRTVVATAYRRIGGR